MSEEDLALPRHERLLSRLRAPDESVRVHAAMHLAACGVDAAVVYVQDGNRENPGPMLGAAFTSLH